MKFLYMLLYIVLFTIGGIVLEGYELHPALYAFYGMVGLGVYQVLSDNNIVS